MLHIKDIEAFARINEALARHGDADAGAAGEGGGDEAHRVAMARLFMQLAAGAISKPPMHVPPPAMREDTGAAEDVVTDVGGLDGGDVTSVEPELPSEPELVTENAPEASPPATAADDAEHFPPEAAAAPTGELVAAADPVPSADADPDAAPVVAVPVEAPAPVEMVEVALEPPPAAPAAVEPIAAPASEAKRPTRRRAMGPLGLFNRIMFGNRS